MATTDPAYRYAMAKYPANGSQTDFTVNFDGGAIHATDIAAFSYVTADYSDQVDETVTLISSNADFSSGTARLGRAVPAGRTVVIYRLTARGEPLVDFINRSMLTELNLNTITKQAIFSVAEMLDSNAEFQLKIGTRADSAVADAAEALEIANEANDTADAALTRANQAYDKGVAAEAGIAAATTAANNAQAAAAAANIAASDATMLVESVQGEVSAAVSTANAAAANANAASDAANAISGKADDAVATANAAGTKADTAVSTANAAKATADGVDAKATDALAQATAANNGVTGKLDKVSSTPQTVASKVEFASEVATKALYTVHRDLPTGTNSLSVLGFWNTAGTTAYGGIDLFSDKILLRHTAGNVTLALQSNGYVNVTGGFNVTGNTSFQSGATMSNTMAHYVGATGVQQITRRIGWASGAQAGAQRWAEVLEGTGGYTLWSYNTTGGNGLAALAITTVNTGVLKTRISAADGQFHANTNYSNSAWDRGAIFTQGSYGGGWAMQSTNDSGARSFYMENGNVFTSYSPNAGAIYSTSAPSGFNHIGGFGVISDKRTKYCLKPMKAEWDKFMAVTPQVGKYRKHFLDDGGKYHNFFVAQDLQPYYPTLVKAPQKWDHIGDLLTVDYDAAVPILWKMVQELRKELVALKEARK